MSTQKSKQYTQQRLPSPKCSAQKAAVGKYSTKSKYCSYKEAPLKTVSTSANFCPSCIFSFLCQYPAVPADLLFIPVSFCRALAIVCVNLISHDHGHGYGFRHLLSLQRKHRSFFLHQKRQSPRESCLPPAPVNSPGKIPPGHPGDTDLWTP